MLLETEESLLDLKHNEYLLALKYYSTVYLKGDLLSSYYMSGEK